MYEENSDYLVTDLLFEQDLVVKGPDMEVEDQVQHANHGVNRDLNRGVLDVVAAKGKH